MVFNFKGFETIADEPTLDKLWMFTEQNQVNILISVTDNSSNDRLRDINITALY